MNSPLRPWYNPLRAYYGRAYNDGTMKFPDGGGFGVGHWEHHERWRRTAETLIRVARNGAFDARMPNLVDAGCGPGVLVDELRAQGAAAIGFDLGDDIRSRWCCIGDIRYPPISPGWASAVVALDVVEHVRHCELRDALKALLRLSRLLILTVPTVADEADEVRSDRGIRHHYSVLTVRGWRDEIWAAGGQVVAFGMDLARQGPPFSYGVDNFPFLVVPGR